MGLPDHAMERAYCNFTVYRSWLLVTNCPAAGLMPYTAPDSGRIPEGSEAFGRGEQVFIWAAQGIVCRSSYLMLCWLLGYGVMLQIVT